MMFIALLIWHVVIAVPATVPFYLATRLHLWREYYTKLNHYVPGPQYIDFGDKLLALVIAWLTALTWPVSIPAYVIRRAFVMRAKKRAAYAYADRKIRELRGVRIDEPR